MTYEIVALSTHRVERGVEMGICGGMRGECILQVGKQFEHVLRPLCLSLSFFNLGLVEVQEVHAGTGTAATAALTLP